MSQKRLLEDTVTFITPSGSLDKIKTFKSLNISCIYAIITENVPVDTQIQVYGLFFTKINYRNVAIK